MAVSDAVVVDIVEIVWRAFASSASEDFVVVVAHVSLLLLLLAVDVLGAVVGVGYN